MLQPTHGTTSRGLLYSDNEAYIYNMQTKLLSKENE